MQSTQGWKSKDNLSGIGSSKAFESATLTIPHPHQKEVHAFHVTDFAEGQTYKARTNVPVTHTEQPAAHIDVQETPTTGRVGTSAGAQQILRD
jgi:hypothetical protein